MKLTEVSSGTTQQFKGEASSVEELLASIVDGRFTLDGRKLVVHGDLMLMKLGLTSLLGCPQHVRGNFICTYNKLETLDGAPQEVGSHFLCYRNKLKTLKGAPQRINGGFDCSYNVLETLEDGPVKINGFYECSENKLISFKGMPSRINGDLSCSNNLLTSFEGCAQTIGGSLYSFNNKLLTSLNGGPSFVGKNVYLEGCTKLTSIMNIHLHFPEVHGLFDFTKTGVKEHMLGLLRVRGLRSIILDDVRLGGILRKYLNGGDLLACALELVEAGYEEQAKL
jgi:hypothetical protein